MTKLKIPKFEEYWKALTPKEKKQIAIHYYIAKQESKNKWLRSIWILSVVCLMLLALLNTSTIKSMFDLVVIFVGINIIYWFILISKKTKV